MTAYHQTKIDGSKIFYREAGPKTHHPFSYCTASPIRNSRRLLAERLLKDVLNHSGLDFAGLVIKRGAMCVQYEDMRDIAFVVLLDQLLLLG
jgi:hypothetical protein